MPATVQLSPVQTLALAALGVAAGHAIKRAAPLLDRLSIPASIVGGLLYAIPIAALHGRILDVQPDTSLRDVLMLACFTLIGMNASWRIVARGGAHVAILLVLGAAGAVLQNLLGMAIAYFAGIPPAFGILAGAVSLAGGPATALAFGPTFEKLGIPAATTVALASAAFGIAVSGLLSGTVGSTCIRWRRLAPEPSTLAAVETAREQGGMFRHVILICVAMGAGTVLSIAIDRAGIVLPGYIGAMIVAAILRNLDDRTNLLRISEPSLGTLFEIALPLFIVLAMLSIRLWELTALAGPLILILAAQTILAWTLSVMVVFPLLGRNYDAAVEATGYCGFMLGITANALATMNEVTRRFGPSPRAFLAVPMVGAFLIDFTNSLIIAAMANLAR